MIGIKRLSIYFFSIAYFLHQLHTHVDSISLLFLFQYYAWELETSLMVHKKYIAALLTNNRKKDFKKCSTTLYIYTILSKILMWQICL